MLQSAGSFIKIRQVGLELLLARRREVQCLEYFSVQMKPRPRSERSRACTQQMPVFGTESNILAANIDSAVNPAPMPLSGGY